MVDVGKKYPVIKKIIYLNFKKIKYFLQIVSFVVGKPDQMFYILMKLIMKKIILYIVYQRELIYKMKNYHKNPNVYLF